MVQFTRQPIMSQERKEKFALCILQGVEGYKITYMHNFGEYLRESLHVSLTQSPFPGRSRELGKKIA